MLIDLTRLVINKLEKNYVRKKERRIIFRVKEHKENKIDKKMCEKDRLQEIVKTIRAEVYNSLYQKVCIKKFI